MKLSTVGAIFEIGKEIDGNHRWLGRKLTDDAHEALTAHEDGTTLWRRIARVSAWKESSNKCLTIGVASPILPGCSASLLEPSANPDKLQKLYWSACKRPTPFANGHHTTRPVPLLFKPQHWTQ